MSVVLDEHERDFLVDLARASVGSGLRNGRPLEVDAARAPATLRAPGASFVTLRRGESLLGCIGTMEPVRPLLEDVAHNAFASAFGDPRLPAVTVDDYVSMSVKISVLGPMQPLVASSRAELMAELKPRDDGLLVTAGSRRGTFLPSVWEQVPDADTFLDLLWQKAGLPPGSWPAEVRIFRYRTLEFGD